MTFGRFLGQLSLLRMHFEAFCVRYFPTQAPAKRYQNSSPTLTLGCDAVPRRQPKRLAPHTDSRVQTAPPAPPQRTAAATSGPSDARREARSQSHVEPSNTHRRVGTNETTTDQAGHHLRTPMRTTTEVG